MKAETPAALSEEVLEALHRRAQDPRDGDDAGDLEIINARALELNEEAADVLEYQVIP